MAEEEKDKKSIEFAEDGKDKKDTDEKTYSEEYVKKLRGESRDRRIRIRELEDEMKELETQVAKLNKTSKKDTDENKDKTPKPESIELVNELKIEIEKAKKQTRNALLKTAYAVEAAKHGVVDPDKTFRLIDIDDKRLDVDLDKSSVDGMDELVQDLIKECSWITSTQKSDNKDAPPAGGTKGPGARPPNQTQPDGATDLQKSFEKANEIGGVKGATQYLAEIRAAKEK